MLAPQTAAAALTLDAENDQPQQQDADTVQAMVRLYTRTVDALAGFVIMVEKAEPEFRTVAEAFHAVHALHAERLARMLAARGSDADPDGSFMGTVNQAVITVRSWVDDIDADLMDGIRSGEEHVMASFADVLETNAMPAEKSALREMRDELGDLLHKTRQVD